MFAQIQELGYCCESDMTHGNIGHLEIRGTKKYGSLGNMRHLEIWGTEI